jgi:hypothetical protein
MPAKSPTIMMVGWVVALAGQVCPTRTALAVELPTESEVLMH